MNSPIALRLAVRQWFARPLRPVLCSLAIAAAVALIVCIGAAMDSLRYTIDHAIGQALGVADIHVRPAQRDTDARVSRALLEQLRARPEVELADARLLTSAALGAGEHQGVYDVVGIDPVLDETLRPKIYEAGGKLSGKPAEAIIDGVIAENMGVKLGDSFLFSVKSNPPRPFKIVGIVERPRLEILARPTLFVPLDLLIKDLGAPDEYNVIDLKLRESSGIDDYDVYAKTLGKELGPAYEVSPGTSSKARMADMTRTLRLFLTLLSTLSAIAASLIIGTTLSVGVQERVRQFGQLRCLGASRRQLAIFLLADAGVMLVIGQILGLLLGVALSAALIVWFPAFFMAYKLSIASIAIALLCGTLATVLGALIPIWQVTRVSPMAAVTAVANRARLSRVWLAGVIGVLFLIIQMLLWIVPGSRDVRVYSYVIVGIPLIFSGWCLIAPALVILLERAGAPILGGLFRVQSSLLRHSWSRTPWRAGAMIAALMIGVVLFTTVRARGQSLRTSMVTPQIPDLVVKKIPSLSELLFKPEAPATQSASQPSASQAGSQPAAELATAPSFSLLSGLRKAASLLLPDAGKEADIVARTRANYPEIRELAPFDYFTVTMKVKQTQLGKILNDEKTTFVAVEPASFADMVPMDFAQGDPKTALKQLESGGYVFVTTEFYNSRHLGVGDKLSFRSADTKGTYVEFTIAAVVSSTGVEVVKNYFDLRATFGDKSVSSVLGSISDARKYFKFGQPTLMLINVNPAVVKSGGMAALRDRLAKDGLTSLSSVEIKQTLNHVLDRVIDGLSVIGLGALLVASLGVANMVIASIHARRFEFGVLRAIGAGRAQLVRLVLAEVTLVGVIAGVLGAGAGLTFAFMATRLDGLLLGFPTNFLDPHLTTAIGVAILLVAVAIALTTLLGWLASVIPAIRGATSAQRTLLAAGRA